jgi:hypothetical protein
VEIGKTNILENKNCGNRKSGGGINRGKWNFWKKEMEIVES